MIRKQPTARESYKRKTKRTIHLHENVQLRKSYFLRLMVKTRSNEFCPKLAQVGDHQAARPSTTVLLLFLENNIHKCETVLFALQFCSTYIIQ